MASAAPLSAADAGQLQAEAKKGGLGSMYAAYGGGVAGLRACAAVDALVEVNAIDTLLSNFILPLQVRPPNCCRSVVTVREDSPATMPQGRAFLLQVEGGHTDGILDNLCLLCYTCCNIRAPAWL